MNGISQCKSIEGQEKVKEKKVALLSQDHRSE